MERIIKYIWFTIKGITPRKLIMLLDYFPTIEELYFTPKFNDISFLNSKEKESLAEKSLVNAEKIYKKCVEKGIKILTIDDINYPAILKEISSPPIVLYIKGNNINLNNEFCVGIVGTRHSTAYGERVTNKFSLELSKENIILVSGLALGIDSVAAKAAVYTKRPTVAVLGTGIDIVYPASNRKLYEEVEKYGMIISEYPPGMPAASWTFPQRNRIIAGLSRGVIIVEGSKKSGSIITANFALEYNRDVFAIPRNIDDYALDGTNYLIKQGAYPMTCVNDLIQCYPELKNRGKTFDGGYYYFNNEQINIEGINNTNETDENTNLPTVKRTNPDEEKILFAIGKDEIHIDKILLKTKMDSNLLVTRLTMLEIEGVIEQLPGKFYRIK